MKFEFDAEAGETIVSLAGDEMGCIDGRIEKTRNGIPHPDTAQFEAFESILLQMSTPDERAAMLHLLAGHIEHVHEG